MTRALTPVLFAADFSSSDGSTQPAYSRVGPRTANFREDWLQRAIAADPMLVIHPCTEGGLTDEGWFYWASEVSTESGSIDVLLVSETGRVAVVETKLSYNPDRRRNVLAQVLDYAVSLPDLDLADLPTLPDAAGVAADQVERHMQEGDFLLIVAGDELDARAVRLGQALLGDHLVNQWELALVEVAVFGRAAGQAGPEHLLVPHLRGVVETESRQVVKVQVASGPTNRVVVERVPKEPSESRERWDEQRFFTALAASSLPAPYKDFGLALRALRDESAGTLLSWGTGKTGSATFKYGGHGLVELYLDGRLGFRTHRPPKAFGEEIGGAYVKGIRKLFTNVQIGNYAWFHPSAPGRELPGLVELIRAALRQAAEARVRPGAAARGT